LKFGMHGFQAILGGTIQVPTLTGEVVLKVSIISQYIILFLMALSVTGEVWFMGLVWQVRPGTQPGQKVVLKKKGKQFNTLFRNRWIFVNFLYNLSIHLEMYGHHAAWILKGLLV